jgi:hypothetical protein
MSYIILADKAEDERAWIDAHNLVVSATEAATLIRGGAGAWAALRAEKNGVRRSFTNRAMTHGTEREPVIAEWARIEFGLIPCSALLIDPDYPKYGASPDAITADGTTIGEYKTTIHDWDTWDDVPPRYRDQMLWQMFITGARKGKLVYEPHEDYIPFYPFPRVLDLDYDEARVEMLRAVADQFMAGGGESTEADLKLDVLLTAYVEAKDRVSVAEAEVERLNELIRDQVDNQPTRFEGSMANLTLSADSVSERFDSVAFKKAQPDIYQTFTKPSPVKGRLTISLRKES